MANKLSEISAKQIRVYLDQVLKTGSHATYERKLASLGKFFAWAKKEAHLATNPIEEYLSQETTNTPQPVKKLFYSSLQNRIIAKFSGKPKLQDLFYKAFYTRPNWYQTYHSVSITNYFHIAILVIFCAALSFGVYDQAKSRTQLAQAYPANPTSPSRYLSFQGRLTNQYGNPITVATDLVFKLYDDPTAGSTLWNAAGTTCSITPDQDGIFSTLLGSTCGSAITNSVFSENAQVYLGVKAGTDAEATPRVQIATVAYALNSETLQGLPAGTGPSAIPFIDSTGKLSIAAASPTIESTSGTFAITSQAMTISTADTTNGAINITPDGTGALNLTFEGTAAGGGAGGFVNATDANLTSGSLYYGSVASNATGYDLLQLQSGSSPTTKFSVNNAGNVYVAGNLGVGVTSPAQKVDISGNLQFSGSLMPNSAAGSSGQFLSSAGAGAPPTWTSTIPATSVAFSGITSGTNTQANMSVGTGAALNYADSGTINASSLIGSTWAIPGTIGSGTPNTGAFTTLTSTGNSFFATTSGNVGIGTTNPLQKLQVAGDINIESGSGVRINNTATSGQYLRGDGTRFVSSAIQIGDLPTITAAGGWTDGGASVYLTTTADNVGIGTTSPASGNKLHVEGQCVEENTLITISNYSNCPNCSKQIPIKNVQPGDKTLSLNEATNQFEYQTVEKTLDMGFKEIYELTTETGKKIETTGNHPYLARTSFSRENEINHSESNHQKSESNLGSDKKPVNINHFDFTDKTIDKYNDSIEANKLAVNTNGLDEANAAINQPAAKSEKNEVKTKITFDEEKNLDINNTLSQWTKVVYLQEGDEIATINGFNGELTFEKIVSIKILPPKHVYDLQISNTHNFVANGIVAHNTYISGNVGIGTTNPSQQLELTGDLKIGGDDLFMATNTANYFLMADGTNYNPVSPADARTGLGLGAGGAGDIWVEKAGDTMTGNLTFSGSQSIIGGTATTADLTLQTTSGVGTTGADMHFLVGNNGATEAMTILNSGNVGIGTTGPVAKLDIGGYIPLFSTALGEAKLSVSTDTNLASGVQMGNINTGTAADFRFLIKDTTDHYMAFAVPGTGNTGTLFGATRSTLDLLFTNGGTARTLAIGTVAASDILFGTNNTERMVINSNGSVDIANDVAIAGNLTVGSQNVCRADGTNCPSVSLSYVGSCNVITATPCKCNAGETIMLLQSYGFTSAGSSFCRVVNQNSISVYGERENSNARVCDFACFK